MTADLLKRAREARGLELHEVATETRISPQFLKYLDNGNFKALPGGLYARAYIRAYARAVGLDPKTTVEQLEPWLPHVSESLEMIVARRSGKILSAWFRQPNSVETAEPVRTLPEPRPELAASSESMTKVSSELPRRPSLLRYLGAVFVDAALLATLDTVVLAAAATTCGVSVLMLLRLATAPMAVIFGSLAVCYFGLFGGIAGKTGGAYLLGIRFLDPPAGPLDLLLAARRSLQCLGREASVLAKIMVASIGYRF